MIRRADGVIKPGSRSEIGFHVPVDLQAVGSGQEIEKAILIEICDPNKIDDVRRWKICELYGSGQLGG